MVVKIQDWLRLTKISPLQAPAMHHRRPFKILVQLHRLLENPQDNSNHVNHGAVKRILLAVSQFRRIHAWMADNPGWLGYDRNMVNWRCLKSSNELFATDARGWSDRNDRYNHCLDGMLSPQRTVGTLRRSKDMHRADLMPVGPIKSRRSSGRKSEDPWNIFEISMGFWKEIILLHETSGFAYIFDNISVQQFSRHHPSICEGLRWERFSCLAIAERVSPVAVGQ